MRKPNIFTTAAGLCVATAANGGIVVWNCNIDISNPDNTGAFVNVESQQFAIDDGITSITLPGTDLFFDQNASRLSLTGYTTNSIAGHSSQLGTANLATGTVVGSTLSSPNAWGVGGGIIVASGNPSRWTAGAIHQFGFRFLNSAGQTRYGWGEIALTSGSLKYGIVSKLVYEDSGASATIGVIPAPGTAALLGLGGLIASRRRR